MIKISFKASFIRKINKLPIQLQEEVLSKIELFKNKDNHKSLKVHKLHGELKGLYSFSVDFKHRIVFDYISKNEATFLVFGDHQIYD